MTLVVGSVEIIIIKKNLSLYYVIIIMIFFLWRYYDCNSRQIFIFEWGEQNILGSVRVKMFFWQHLPKIIQEQNVYSSLQ